MIVIRTGEVEGEQRGREGWNGEVRECSSGEVESERVDGGECGGVEFLVACKASNTLVNLKQFSIPSRQLFEHSDP